jgi:hypothetical protein
MKQIFLLPKLASIFFLVGLMSLTSCKKDNNTTNTDNPDPALSVDAVQSDDNAASQFEDVFNITMGVQSSDAGEDIGLGTGGNIIYRTDGTASPDTRCFTVTVVPKILHEFPKTVTWDFGNGCVGKDGKLRSGKIVTIFTGPMLVPGSKASTSFINYNVDSFKIEGTHTIENKSTSNHFAWQVNIINGKITNTQTNKWVEWSTVRNHEQIKGNGSPFYSLDNVYQITGSSEGSKSNGNSWTSEITQPVIRKFTCIWRVKGEITFSRNSNTKTAVLDYGDGSCDDQATVTLNGKSYVITLH